MGECSSVDYWAVVDQLRAEYLKTIDGELRTHEAQLADDGPETREAWQHAREAKASAYIPYMHAVDAARRSKQKRPTDTAADARIVTDADGAAGT